MNLVINKDCTADYQVWKSVRVTAAAELDATALRHLTEELNEAMQMVFALAEKHCSEIRPLQVQWVVEAPHTDHGDFKMGFDIHTLGARKQPITSEGQKP